MSLRSGMSFLSFGCEARMLQEAVKISDLAMLHGLEGLMLLYAA